MQTKLAAVIAVFAVIAAVVGFVATNSHVSSPQGASSTIVQAGQPPTSAPTTANAQPTTTTQQATPFNSSSLYPYSYLISGNATLSPQGKAATSDFSLAATPLNNGSVLYILMFVDTKATYNATVAPGNKLYFIDRNLADDSPSSDSSSGDDGYAVVNATGYIVSMAYPLPRA